MNFGCVTVNGVNSNEKHASRVSQVIAAVAKVSCKHGHWLVAHVNKNPREIPGDGYGVE